MKRLTVPLSLLVLFCTVTGPSQTLWMKLANPVLDVGSPGSWDDQWAIASRVIRVGDTLKMWYSGRRNFFGIISIGYAWSVDGGVTWMKNPSPVLTPTRAWETQAVWQPYVILQGSLYKMWYNGGSGGGAGGIGYAWSTDGIQWTKSTVNPVVTPGPSSWDADNVEGPCVLPDGSAGFKMWYEGVPVGLDTLRVCYATATSETTWAKAPGINPVLSPIPGTWEPTWLRSPRVMFDGSTYQMWYSAGPPYNTNNRGIGYATSPDGIAWTRQSLQPLLQSTLGTWEQGGIWPGDIVSDSTMFTMWYMAGYLNTLRSGIAVSPKGLVATILPQDTVRIGDTVLITVRTQHTAGLSFFAEILDASGVKVDSIGLFDDGTHDDSLAGDGIFTNRWPPGPLNATYSVNLGLRLHDTLQFGKATHVTSFTVPVLPDPRQPLPLTNKLEQNYPNPFNPTTTIGYELPKSTDVRLSVYDLLGRQVAVLVSGRQGPGQHEVKFDARGLSSGVYFYRLTAGLFTQTRKLLLSR